MSAHNATAVRRNGPGRIWFSVCPAGCALPSVASKEQAEHEAMKHRIRAALSQLQCQCFHGDEFDPAGPCPKCLIADALDAA